MHEEIVAVVNVTDPDGVLLGRFEITKDDLVGTSSADQWIGEQVRHQLPRNENI